MLAQPRITCEVKNESDEKVLAFFEETKKELGIVSTQKLAGLISRIFSGVRRTLTESETSEFLKGLPDLLQLLFISNWKYDEGTRRKKIEHLDELVESIFYDDRKSVHSMFHSEIETLNAVVVILSKLDKTMGVLNFSGFSFSLVQEIRQATLEDAA